MAGAPELTDDDMVLMASEMGVLDIPQHKIVKKWRLQPGKMFLIDTDVLSALGKRQRGHVDRRIEVVIAQAAGILSLFNPDPSAQALPAH